MRQAFVLWPVLLAKRVVPARIEDDDEGLVLDRADLGKQVVQVDAFGLDVAAFIDSGIDGDEIIPPIQLHAVAGVIEDGELGVGSQDRVREPIHRFHHVSARCVDMRINREPRSPEQAGHRLRVVGGIRQRHAVVGAVADHEGLVRRVCLGGKQIRKRQDRGDSGKALDECSPRGLV